MHDDPHELRRFLEAQDGEIEPALEEIRSGRKRSHWMWFVFPQLKGLGASSMAWRYGLESLDEAAAYLAHPVLGPRLAAAVAAVDGPAGRRTGCGADRGCGGRPDPRTMALLNGG